jgi:hypothetical protein
MEAKFRSYKVRLRWRVGRLDSDEIGVEGLPSIDCNLVVLRELDPEGTGASG